jgi:hypothetical protein
MAAQTHSLSSSSSFPTGTTVKTFLNALNNTHQEVYNAKDVGNETEEPE